MKKKIAMRVASLALCVAFTASAFGAPKSKAVAVETAIGTAAVASYFQATGLTMAASAGSTGALVTTGVADIVGSYAVATGASSSGSAFLSSLAAGVSISPAGALVLTAAAVVAIGALVAWYIGDAGLDAEGDTAVAVPGSSDSYSYNGVVLPALPELVYTKALIFNFDEYGFYLYVSSQPLFFEVSTDRLCNLSSLSIPYCNYVVDSDVWALSGDSQFASGTYLASTGVPIWANYDLRDETGSVYLGSSEPVLSTEGQLEVIRSPEFVQLDSDFTPESQKQMVIDLGFGAGTTLDTVAEEVPNLIAAGELAPTYEIESTAPEVDDDLPYIPILSEILQGVQSIAGTVVDGILNGLEGLFVPSETYLEALPAQITDTFEDRTGFLTYPFSLLPDFVDRLSATSSDWVISWPQIVEPFSNTVLFHQGSWNVSAFLRSDLNIQKAYELWRLLAKAFMSFGFLALCYNKYRSIVGDDYGGV